MLRTFLPALVAATLFLLATASEARRFAVQGPPGWTATTSAGDGTVTLQAPRKPMRIVIRPETTLPPGKSLKEYVQGLVEARLGGAAVLQQNEGVGRAGARLGVEEYGLFVAVQRGPTVSCWQYGAFREGNLVAVYIFESDDMAAFADNQKVFLNFIGSIQLPRVAVAPSPVPVPASTPTRVTPPKQQAVKGKRYAVLIGVANYQNNGVNSLQFTINDVLALQKALVDPKVGRFPAENVRVLTDRSAAPLQPNRINVEKALSWLEAMTRPEDTVLIFFSGHGFGDARTGSYLLTRESDPEALLSTSINTSDFTDMVDAIPARKKLVILDACHSGGMPAAARDSNKMTEDLRNQLLAQESAASGQVRLLSCRDDEQSFEDPGLQQGVFTNALVKGLRGAADADGDRLVTDGELLGYVQAEVRKWAVQRGKRQTPTFEKTKAEGTMILSDLKK